MTQQYIQAQKELTTYSIRFREKVYINGDGCWLWRARLNSWGYGTYYEAHRMRLAHHFAWEAINGSVPAGLVLDHKCCNPECARPAHLRLVTLKQNNEHRNGPNRNNSSGVRGVRYHGGSWVVRVRHHNVLHELRGYPTRSTAETAAIALRAKLFTHDDGRRI